MAPAKQEEVIRSGLLPPSREKGPASEDEDAVPPSPETDWTLALEEICVKRQRGNEYQDDPDHHYKALN